MKRTFGFLAIVLGVLGLAGCLAGLGAVWVYRTPATQASLELLDAADDGLQVVDDNAKRAADVVAMVKEVVDPVARKLLDMADKAKSTGRDEEELTRLDEKLAERLRQVDALVQTSEKVVAVMNKTTRLTRSLPWKPASVARKSEVDDQKSADDLRGSGEILSRLAERLKAFHATLTKVREDRQIRKEIVDKVVDLARNVDSELNLLEDKLGRVRQRAAELQTEVSELRADIPCWITSSAVVSSVILAWMALGQFALACLGRRLWCKSG